MDQFNQRYGYNQQGGVRYVPPPESIYSQGYAYQSYPQLYPEYNSSYLSNQPIYREPQDIYLANSSGY